MRLYIGLGVAMGLGGALAFVACGKDDNKCRTVSCGYTFARVDIIDEDGDEASATKVTYTLTPYNDDGTLMDEDQLHDAGVDPDESHDATCGSDDEDDCSVWIAAAGFGVYTFSAEVDDDDGNLEATGEETVNVPPPDASEESVCCGLINDDREDLTVVEIPTDTAS